MGEGDNRSRNQGSPRNTPKTAKMGKTKQGSDNILEDSAKSFSENVSRSAPFALASYTLVGAIIMLGLIGYGIDRWRGTSPWFLLGGLLIGIVVGFYDLARVVWKR